MDVWNCVLKIMKFHDENNDLWMEYDKTKKIQIQKKKIYTRWSSKTPRELSLFQA